MSNSTTYISQSHATLIPSYFIINTSFLLILTKDQQHSNTVNIVISVLYLLAKIEVFVVLPFILNAGTVLVSVPLLICAGFVL